MQADNSAPPPADTPRVLRVEKAHSVLKKTSRATWNTYISRLDRDQYTVLSCWLLLITSVGLFIVLLLTFGKQFCMVVFLSISGLVVLFVLATRSSQSVAHGEAEPPSAPTAPAYQLRKPSMMFEKYNEACHVALPPSSGSRAPHETAKRGFFRALISRLRKGHLQVNPYYTTLTEDAPSIEGAVVENPVTKPSTRRSFDPGKDPTPDTKKRIGFQEEPLMQMEGEQLTGVNTPTSTQSTSRRHRRSHSIRPMTDTEISSHCRVDRSMSVFATVTPGSSVPGLRPLKSGIKGSVTPKLGAPAAKRTGSTTSTRRTVNFTGLYITDEESVSAADAQDGKSARSPLEKKISTTGSVCSWGIANRVRRSLPAKGSSSSRKRHHDSHASSSSPDLRIGSSRTYVLRDPANGYRKIHHVWGH
ncbi:hypothetical protein HPB51_016995 [Rhipicephalus microplus]|uniref:Uncharacterized protein n=1 Tax=Rhipicephalus microplus TaxID=6941 RepID=A0A9J6F403_RHIMP|nr:hypothetical protein HPB51_016995 [Rhipicephalus microplus]